MQVKRMVQASASTRDCQFSSLLSEFVPVPRNSCPDDVWGTNREAYEVDCTAFTGGVCISFYTAWSPPIQWVAALSALMPKALIELDYSQENDDFAGKMVAHDGVAVDKCILSLHFSSFGFSSFGFSSFGFTSGFSFGFCSFLVGLEKS